MRSLRIPLLAILALHSLPLAGDDEWIEGRSEHFRAVSNAKKGRVEDTLEDLEQIRRLISVMWSGQPLDSSRPATFFLFKNDKSMRPFEPVRNGEREDWGAMSRWTRFADFILIEVDGSRDSVRELTYSQYIQLVLRYQEIDYPVWFENGVGRFFGNARISKDKAEVGKMHPGFRRVLGEFRSLPLRRASPRGI